MSLTSTVPAAVPSLFHSSLPCVPSSAVKKSVPSTAVRTRGTMPPVGLMSLTSTVPAAVPSLFHNSSPLRAVVGGEEERAADGDERPGTESPPGLMSLTSVVPGGAVAAPEPPFPGDCLRRRRAPRSGSSRCRFRVPGVDVLDERGRPEPRRRRDRQHPECKDRHENHRRPQRKHAPHALPTPTKGYSCPTPH